MRTPNYDMAIEWIALNDEPTIMDCSQMEDLISVLLVADLFGRTPKSVANHVISFRSDEAKAWAFARRAY